MSITRKHPYEYIMMAEFLTPLSLGGSLNFAEAPAQASLVRELGRLSEKLPTILSTAPIGEDWQINSHSVALISNTFIVTFLLRRPRQIGGLRY